METRSTSSRKTLAYDWYYALRFLHSAEEQRCTLHVFEVVAPKCSAQKCYAFHINFTDTFSGCEVRSFLLQLSVTFGSQLTLVFSGKCDVARSLKIHPKLPNLFSLLSSTVVLYIIEKSSSLAPVNFGIPHPCMGFYLVSDTHC